MADTKLINANIDENAGIAWLILNRPEKKNALSIILLAELSSILRALAENDKIRCIVTTGGGDSYSSGRDLYDMRGQDNRRRTRGDCRHHAQTATGDRCESPRLVSRRRLGADQRP